MNDNKPHTTFEDSFSLIAAQRALIYQWFADWLAVERSAADLARYQSPAAAQLWEHFAACGLEQESRHMQQALNEALSLPDSRLEIAADFAAAFLLAADYCATPYASWYVEADKKLYGDAEKRMRAFLREQQLQIHSDFKEPADHLAVFLAVFAHWLQTERQAPTNAAAEQARFLEEALLNWLPLWEVRCRQLHLKTKVYPALAALLLAFVQADKAYLRGE